MVTGRQWRRRPINELSYLKKKNPKRNRRNGWDFASDKPFICTRLCACVCLDLVLLLVRWVSVKRITTVSLLYPHTHCLGDLHSQDPLSTASNPPILCTTRLGRELDIYFEYKRRKMAQSLTETVTGAGQEWVTCTSPQCLYSRAKTQNNWTASWNLLHIISFLPMCKESFTIC